jgi:hypothetical protein
MTFSEKHFSFRYKIESKPGGGFIARTEDPADTMEAATLEEMEAKMREKLAALAGPEASEPDLSQLPLDQPGAFVKTPMRAKFTFSLGNPSSDKLASAPAPARLQAATPKSIEPAGNSLLSALWKAAVLVGIAIIIWLLLHRS